MSRSDSTKKIISLEFEQPKDSSLGAQMVEIVDFLEFLKTYPDEREFIIDLSNIKFVHPLFTLSIASLKNFLAGSGYSIQMKLSFWN